MNTQELREKSVVELQQVLAEELRGQFKLRMQKTAGELNQTHLLREARRNVARIKTVISEKVRSA